MITFTAELLTKKFDAEGLRMAVLHCAEFDKVIVVTHRFENGDLLISAKDLLDIAKRAGVNAGDMLVMACHPGVNRNEDGWMYGSDGEWYPTPIEGDWMCESVIAFGNDVSDNLDPKDLVKGAFYTVSYMDLHEGAYTYGELRG